MWAAQTIMDGANQRGAIASINAKHLNPLGLSLSKVLR